MKNLSKKKKIFISSGIGLLILIAIGSMIVISEYSKKDEVKEEEENNIVETEEEEEKIMIIDLDSNSRSYAVMINNVSAVWKFQSGLNEAYLVYELLVEGGITRELALYKDASEDVKIQSIRSARHYYLDYVLENDAIFVHWGWSSYAKSDISSLGINNINGLTYENTYFFRDNTVTASSEHRGYSTIAYLNKATEKLGYRNTTDEEPLLSYSAKTVDLDSIEGATSAEYVAVKFSASHTSKWTYDSDAGVYYKTQNNTEMIDYTSKEKIYAKNIITYQVIYSTISGDTKGRQEMSNIGSGTGYYITEGVAVPITWEKTSRSSKTVYKLLDGTVLTVNDGNTYIEIQPTGQSLTIE